MEGVAWTDRGGAGFPGGIVARELYDVKPPASGLKEEKEKRARRLTASTIVTVPKQTWRGV